MSAFTITVEDDHTSEFTKFNVYHRESFDIKNPTPSGGGNRDDCLSLNELTKAVMEGVVECGRVDDLMLSKANLREVLRK